MWEDLIDSSGVEDREKQLQGDLSCNGPLVRRPWRGLSGCRPKDTSAYIWSQNVASVTAAVKAMEVGKKQLKRCLECREDISVANIPCNSLDTYACGHKLNDSSTAPVAYLCNVFASFVL